MNKKPPSNNVLLFLLYISLNIFQVAAQPGQFDSSFNSNGIAFSGTREDALFPLASLVQPDGKILVSGDSYSGPEDAFIVRFNENGSLDSNFGIAGKVRTDFASSVDRFHAIAILQNGKIVSGGTNDVSGSHQRGILARYHHDGRPDSSFGISGKIISDFASGSNGYAAIWQIEEKGNGKLKISGNRSFLLGSQPSTFTAMLKDDGAFDSSFGINGIQDISSLVPGLKLGTQKDGKTIYTANKSSSGINYFQISRFFPNGDLDKSFNGNGSISIFKDQLGGQCNGGIVMPDDKILVYATVNKRSQVFNNNNATDFALLKITQDGRLDSSFGIKGITTTDFNECESPSRLSFQTDGKILLAGTSDYISELEGFYVMARYQTNGLLDSTFADNGKKNCEVLRVEGSLIGMHLQDKRIYLVGWAVSPYINGAMVVAFKNDGSLLAPVTKSLCGISGNTTLISDATGSVFQWQVRKDSSGFADIHNDAIHMGVTSSTLTLEAIPLSHNGYQYRCVTDKGTSNVFTLHFSNRWTGTKNDLWEDPANWSCGEVPNENTNVVIEFGPVLLSSSATIHSLKIKEGVACTVATGATLTINSMPAQAF